MFKQLKAVHWVWIFLFLDLTAFWIQSSSSGTMYYAQAYRVAMLSISGSLIIALVAQKPNATGWLFRSPLIFYWLFALYSVVSTIYSSHPIYTAWKGIELTLLGLAAALVLERSTNDNIKSISILYLLLMRLLRIVLIAAWVYAIIFPEKGFPKHVGSLGYMMQGLLNSNSLGAVAAIVGIHSFSSITNRKGTKIIHSFFFILSVTTLIMAYSRTSIIGFAVAFIVFSFFSKKIILSVLATVMVLVISLSNAALNSLFGFLSRGQSLGGFRGMSGRAETWGKAIKYFLESPYYGHGHMSAGRYDVLENASSHLHGTPIEIMVGLGIIGLVLWLMFIIITGINLLKLKDIRVPSIKNYTFRAELLALFSYLIVRSGTSSILAMHSFELMVFVCISCFSMARIQFANAMGELTPKNT